jgi:hypothetical protein
MKATAAMAAHKAMPGAARRRLSGAHKTDESTATALLRIEDGDELAFADRLAFADLDFLDGSRLGREHGISIFIDSRIMISPSTSMRSPGLVWIFHTLPAISDFTLTTAMPRSSPECAHRAFSATARASARAELPTRAPRRYAASLAAETIPSCKVERPSPMRAD